MDYQTLLYRHDGHVVTLVYNRPEQHNAVNRQMNRELHHAWQRFRDDDEAFVLVITGAGETTFCAGWDLQDAVETGRLVFGQRRILRLYVSRPLIPAVLLRPLPAVKVKGRIAEVEVYALV